MNKLILPTFVVTALLLATSYATHIHAQTGTPPTTSPVVSATAISDYAKDVKDGEKGTANDVEAQNNQKDIADNENIEAQEETEAVEPVEAIEPEEAVEPQEAVENESEGDSSGGKSSSEGSKQESGSSSESNKQPENENSGKSVEGVRTQRGY